MKNKNTEIFDVLLKHKEYSLLKQYIKENKFYLLQSPKDKALVSQLSVGDREKLGLKEPVKQSKENISFEIFKLIQKFKYNEILYILKTKKDFSFLMEPITAQSTENKTFIKKSNGFSLLHFLAKAIYLPSDEHEKYQNKVKEHQKLIDFLKTKKLDFNKPDLNFNITPLDLVFLEADFNFVKDNKELFKNYDISKKTSLYFIQLYRDSIHHFMNPHEKWSEKYFDKLKLTLQNPQIPLLFVPILHIADSWTTEEDGNNCEIVKYFAKFPDALKQTNAQGKGILALLLSNASNKNVREAIIDMAKNNLFSHEDWNLVDLKGKKPFFYLTDKVIEQLPRAIFENFTVLEKDLELLKSPLLRQILEEKVLKDIVTPEQLSTKKLNIL